MSPNGVEGQGAGDTGQAGHAKVQGKDLSST